MASSTDEPKPDSGPTDSSSGESAAVPAKPAEGEGLRRAIRIGSQRYQQPTYGARPAALPPAEPAAAPAQPAATAVAAFQAAPQVAPASPVLAVSEEPPAVAAEAPPASRARREQPIARPAAPTRSELNRMTAELEDEVNAALEGMSLEQVLSGTVTANEELLQPESKLRAQVAKVHHDDVFLSLPGRHQGLASLRQFARPPSEGDMLEVVILRFNADEGLYEVAVPGGAASVENWDDVVEGTLVEARITAANTGGLECQVNTLRGFIPASQVSLYRAENLTEFLDQKLLCVVTEANRERRNLVLSRKAVLEREQHEVRQKTLASLEVGAVREGVVRRLQDFGAFVDIGGIDGLVHVSQMSWDRIKHPSEVLAEGQKISVRIEKIDPQTGKIGLSYRNTQESPWAKAAQKYPVSSVVKGQVSKLAEFGAFVKLEPGIEGLVHVSELAFHRVSRASTIVQVGEEVEVKVLAVDPENQRMSLSLKQARAQPAVETAAETEPEPEPETPPAKKSANKPLKGGLGRGSSGSQFGLKW